MLWYSTYQVGYSGKYQIINDAKENRDIFFDYTFPTKEGIYDNFCFIVDGEKIKELQPTSGKILKKLNFGPGKAKKIEITYESQGMDEWWYLFGSDVSQIQNFKLAMITNFDKIDFPENSISPTKKERKDKGWELTWRYSNLISGIQIGMDMPQRLNPGPFVSRVSFFAPVSLFLFLFLIFIITVVKKINIHPMNYFFISAAFFSFHLLLAYLVDHIDIHLSFVICSSVSIFLVISYMRLVVGVRFALLETGLSQFVYLVLFSYAFFLEGLTGLAITICCILTLFVVMQFTGRIDWEKQFVSNK
ncbi:MAG: inner membrane CreD family protein [bacterium]